MKKLMFAAVVAAMAMGAKADVSLGIFYFDVQAQFANGTPADGYTDCYIVSASDYNTWWNGGNYGDIASLKNVISHSTLMPSYSFPNSREARAVASNLDEVKKVTGYSDFGDIGSYQTVSDGISYAVIYNPTSKDAFGIPNCSSWVRISDYELSGSMDYRNSLNPHSAPEPTSALLMLLGMAGLALRRKQA